MQRDINKIRSKIKKIHDLACEAMALADDEFGEGNYVADHIGGIACTADECTSMIDKAIKERANVST